MQCHRIHMRIGNTRTYKPQGKSISSSSTCAKASLRISRRPTAQDSGTFTKEMEQSLSIPSTLILGSCRCLNSPTCASQPWCARNGTPLSTGRLCSWTLFTSRSALTCTLSRKRSSIPQHVVTFTRALHAFTRKCQMWSRPETFIQLHLTRLGSL